MTEAELELLEPGAIFHGRYRIVSCLSRGGMGAVYEVIHLETRRRRALKTMLPTLLADPDMRSRFHLEANVAAEIESDHIIDVFDAGVDDATGLPFLVMELLRGESLAGTLERGPLPAADVLLLLHQASLALERTHAAGIVHRDLKPENVFLTAWDDGTLHVKLLDFGIAKVVPQSTLAHTTRSFGTPLYMSPEQIRGDAQIGPAADLYALGQLAFTLLVGHPYWEAESKHSTSIYSLLLKVLRGVSELASQRAKASGVTLPPSFDAWFGRATALEPAQRYQSASELVDAFAQALKLEVPRPERPSFVINSKNAGRVTATLTLQSAKAALRIEADASQQKGAGAADSTGALASGAQPDTTARRARVWLGAVLLGATVAALIGLGASLPRAPPAEAKKARPAETSPPAAPAPSPITRAAGEPPAKAAAAELESVAEAEIQSAPRIVATARRLPVLKPRSTASSRAATVQQEAYDPTDIR